MSWQQRSLGSVADFIRGITFKPDDVVLHGEDDSVACFRTKNVQKDLDLADLWAVPRSFVKREDQFVREGDLLVSTANSWNLVGKCSWVPSLPWQATLGGFISSLRPNAAEVDARYLYHWFSSDHVQALVRSCARQTTNIANLSIERCSALNVPLPPLPEQRRIASILDQADTLRRMRRQALLALSDLQHALFYDMFGDPVSNPKGWEAGTVRDLVVEAKYGTAQKANTDGKGLPILRMGNITYDGRIDFTDLKHVELPEKDYPKYTTQIGDLLFNRTNSKELVGKTAVVNSDEPMAIAGYLVRVRTNERGNPHYISGFLNSRPGKAVLQNMCKNIVGMANINAQELQDIVIALPPISLQDEFAKRLKMIDIQRSELENALAECSALFTSLQHRAFRGEL